LPVKRGRPATDCGETQRFCSVVTCQGEETDDLTATTLRLSPKELSSRIGCSVARLHVRQSSSSHLASEVAAVRVDCIDTIGKPTGLPSTRSEIDRDTSHKILYLLPAICEFRILDSSENNTFHKGIRARSPECCDSLILNATFPWTRYPDVCAPVAQAAPHPKRSNTEQAGCCCWRQSHCTR